MHRLDVLCDRYDCRAATRTICNGEIHVVLASRDNEIGARQHKTRYPLLSTQRNRSSRA